MHYSSCLADMINEDTYCISDPHLGYGEKTSEWEPIRKEMAHNAGYEDLDQFVIDSISNEVPDSGTILMLGDFAFKAIEHYSNQLKANKVIILGNHDRKAPLYRSYGWSVFEGVHYHIDGLGSSIFNDSDVSLLSGLVKEVCGKKVLFSHYPVFDNNAFDRGNEMIDKRVSILQRTYTHFDCQVNIHGHTHSLMSSFDRCINASCEPLMFKPRKLSELLNI